MLQPDFFVLHLLGRMRHFFGSGSTGCQCRAEYNSSSAPCCSTSNIGITSQNCVIIATTLSSVLPHGATLLYVGHSFASRTKPFR